VVPVQSLHVEVLNAPVVTTGDGHSSLLYEVHATNVSTRRLIFTGLDVLDGRTGTLLDRADVERATRRLGVPDDEAPGLAPGRRTVFYLDLASPGRSVVSLVHAVSFDLAGAAKPMPARVVGGATRIRRLRGDALGAPLRGGPWTAVYLPEENSGHRRYIYAVSGRARIPGRYAIDWMPARGFVPVSSGSAVHADGSGADVLAVADARVVHVKPEPPLREPRGVEDETGAMIVLRLSDGRYVSYQHLGADMLVQPGQQVRRGQVIARVGSSGHVTQPHLHLHVADGPEPLDSEGLPFRLDEGLAMGRYGSAREFDAGADWRHGTPVRVAGHPDAMAVLTFR